MDDLILGRDAYVNGEYDDARERLRPLVNIVAPTPRVSAIVTAARRYYAACLYAQRQEDQARAMLEQMLRDDPFARLDPTQYETRFVRFFELLQRDLQPELDTIITERVHTRDQIEARRRANEALMFELVSHESEIERVPRELMFAPFGVGQFANGQRALGVVFLTLETVLTATCLTTFALHQAAYPLNGRFNLDQVSEARYAQGLELTNWISAGLLGAAVIGGVIQANVAWQPLRRRVVVPRPVPHELEGAHLVAGASPDGATVGLRLTF